MSIEVFDGAFGAARWADAHGDSLTETALLHGAKDWSWHRHTWGVIFEVNFADEAAWDAFRLDLAVVTALEAVPDPVSGLIVYRGRGGSSGRPQPRRPRPLIGSGAAALPVPQQLEDEVFDFGAFRTDLERRTLTLAG
jgi:hypothetical protein